MDSRYSGRQPQQQLPFDENASAHLHHPPLNDSGSTDEAIHSNFFDPLYPLNDGAAPTYSPAQWNVHDNASQANAAGQFQYAHQAIPSFHQQQASFSQPMLSQAPHLQHQTLPLANQYAPPFLQDPQIFNRYAFPPSPSQPIPGEAYNLAPLPAPSSAFNAQGFDFSTPAFTEAAVQETIAPQALQGALVEQDNHLVDTPSPPGPPSESPEVVDPPVIADDASLIQPVPTTAPSLLPGEVVGDFLIRQPQDLLSVGLSAPLPKALFAYLSPNPIDLPVSKSKFRI